MQGVRDGRKISDPQDKMALDRQGVVGGGPSNKVEEVQLGNNSAARGDED